LAPEPILACAPPDVPPGSGRLWDEGLGAIRRQARALTSSRTQLLTEIRVHRAISHPNVVRFDSFFEDENNVYMFMELCPNGSLADMVRARGALTEPEARGFMVQLVQACRYLHHHGIIHRDLKLGNVFIAGDMTLRVGDFGLATKLLSREERKRTVCGTPNYIAPEVLEAGSDGHSLEVDVWSLGVILFTMLVGRPPFETKDVKQTYALIRRASFAFPAGAAASPQARDLVRSMLSVDPSRRPSLAAVLTHPFFTGPAAFIPAALPSSATSVPPFLTAAALVPGRSVIEATLAAAPGGLRRRIRMTGPGTERPDEAPAPKLAAAPPPAVAAADVRRRFVAKAAGAPSSSSAAAPAAPRRVALSVMGGNRGAPGAGLGKPAARRPLAAPPALPSSSGAQAGASSSSSAAAGNRSPGHAGPSTASAAAPPRAAPRGLAALSAGAGHTVRFGKTGYGPEPAPTIVAFVDDELRDDAGARADNGAAREDDVASVDGSDAGIGAAAEEDEDDVDMGEECADAPLARSTGLAPPPRAASVTPSVAAARGAREPGTLARVVSALQRSLDPSAPSAQEASAGKAPAASAAPRGASSSSSSSSPQVGAGVAVPEVWVVKWVDYTSKYGLGFLLSDGSVGVHFMDLSKIVTASDGHAFEYCPALPHEDRPRDPSTGRRVSPVERHTTSDYPESLKKKVTLLLHFRKYLLEHWQRAVDDGSALQEEVASIAAGSAGRGLVYLRKWLRTEHAAVFRLSDRTVQACFFDGSSVTLSPDAAGAIFTDKLGRRSRHELATVAEQGGPSVVKRLRYVKDLLASLVADA